MRSLQARNSRSFNRPLSSGHHLPSASVHGRGPRTRAPPRRSPPDLRSGFGAFGGAMPQAPRDAAPTCPPAVRDRRWKRCRRLGLSAPAAAAGRGAGAGTAAHRARATQTSQPRPGQAAAARRTTIRKWLQLRGARAGALPAGPPSPLTGCRVCGYILLRSRIIHAASGGAGGRSGGDQGCRRGGGDGGQGRPGPAAPGLAGHRRQQRGATAAASATLGGRCHIPRGRSAGDAGRFSRAPPPLHGLRRAASPVRRRARWRRAGKAPLPAPARAPPEIPPAGSFPPLLKTFTAAAAGGSPGAGRSGARSPGGDGGCGGRAAAPVPRRGCVRCGAVPFCAAVRSSLLPPAPHLPRSRCSAAFFWFFFN